MQTEIPSTPEPQTSEPDAARPRHLWRWILAVVGVGLAWWGLFAVDAYLTDPVRSAAAYHQRDAQTRQAGTDIAQHLTRAKSVGTASPKGSTSCVDDFGVDGLGETRDEPTYVWRLRYRSHGEYLAEVKRLRAEWRARGWQVSGADPDADPAVVGVSAITGDGIDLSLTLDFYTSQPVLTSHSGCMRHRTDD
ncbi:MULTISPECIES: hypothetical protein [Streptomyces]|uniref:hypothetical protein n=1 Tax=Streptomyces TaxID=1883 RepID=UPI0006B28858|nr:MULTISPECIES: hypothetical protein [Streptomyces]